MTFGKVMGGGFPAAAFGGRADVMARARAGGPVYQAGTLSGNPVADDRRPGHAAAGHRRGLRPPRTPRRRDQGRGPTALSAPGSPHVVQSAGTMFSVFFTDGRGPRLRRRAAHRLAAYAAFFHAMLDRGCTCRRRRTRRGSSRRPRRPAPCRPCSTRCPSRRARPQPRRRPTPVSSTTRARPRTPCPPAPATARCQPRGRLFGRRDGYHLSALGLRMADRVAAVFDDRDITHVRSSPLERAGERAPMAAAHASNRHRDRVIRATKTSSRGKRVRQRQQRAAEVPPAWRVPLEPLEAVVGGALQGGRVCPVCVPVHTMPASRPPATRR
jgi:hypothetical protein